MDQQLLNVARDYFHFVIKFFEVIKVSAPHIYHSALELSPKSSLIQEHYHWWLPQHSKPRVVYGVPSSWNQPSTNNGNYGSYTWSPCSQFFSVRTLTSVEIWDALTLEKHSNLQLTEHQVATEIWDPHYHSPNILAYSPDGRSLACCFGFAITIWDVQTGGIADEIECVTGDFPELLVWSLDGTTICTIFPEEVGTWIVVIYDVASGEDIFIGTFSSSSRPHLWPHNNSLWIMVTLGNEDPILTSQTIINIHEVWPNFTGLIKSFSINLDLYGKSPIISFSPSTYRISTVTYPHFHLDTLFAFDIQSSKVLLEERGPYTANCLSPDGSLLIASRELDDVYIWKYTSGQDYIPWRKLPVLDSSYDIPQGYQFSPTSSSVLISRVGFLDLQHLDSQAVTDPPAEAIHHYDQFSIDGVYVVTAPEYGWSIKITNLHNNSSQFIDTEFVIHGLALTGNILLVEGADELVGWQLTAEGTVDGVLDNRRGNHNDSLWTRPMSESFAQFWVDGHIGVIKTSEDPTYWYNTETGEELESVPVNIPLSSWRDLHSSDFKAQHSSSCHDFVECDDPPKDGPIMFIPWYKDGWVKYPEGEYQHRFWLPAHWRRGWDEAHWLDNVMTLRLVTDSGLVIVKF